MTSKSLRLILVRHGETVGNSSVRYYGRTDVVLSPLGRAQMRSAAGWLQTSLGCNYFEIVFSSPLMRAVESARLIVGPNADVIQLDEFVEVDFGLFEGLTADEIRKCYPQEFERWNRDRLALKYQYPDGESRPAFTGRVNRGIDLMLSMLDQLPSTRNALLVAHRGVIRVIMQRLTDVTPVIEIGSIHVLSTDRVTEAWQADAVDMTAHL
jgi:broad specificity phosphatase PhoE